MKNSSQRLAEALRATAAMIATVDDRPSGGWGSRTITLADVAGIFHAFADQIDAAERPDLRDQSTTGSSASAKEAAEARQRVAFGTSPHGSADDDYGTPEIVATCVAGRPFEYQLAPTGFVGWFRDERGPHYLGRTVDELLAYVLGKTLRQQAVASPVAEFDAVRPVAYVRAEVADVIAGPFYASAAPPIGARSFFLRDLRFLKDGRLYAFRYIDHNKRPPVARLLDLHDMAAIPTVSIDDWKNATPVGSHLCFSFDVFHHFDAPTRPPFVIGRDRYDAIVATLDKFAAHITKGPR